MKGVTPELFRCPEGSDPWAAVQRRAGCICSRSSGCTSTSCNVQALVENRTDVRVESNVQRKARICSQSIIYSFQQKNLNTITTEKNVL